jgi:hypothetical protein
MPPPDMPMRCETKNDMKVGDRFKVDQNDYRKCLFEIKTLTNGDVIAHDVNEPKKPLVTPVIYSFMAEPMEWLESRGKITWIT